jgi:hypothetical protein
MAYKAVAIERMLSEANYFAEQLHLPIEQPITLVDAQSAYVRPPRVGFGGVIQTKRFSFSFPNPNEGKLCYITRQTIRDGHDVLDLYPELARTPSLVDSNGAYQLATQWLTSVAVDVPSLQQKYPVNVRQWFFWGKPENLPKDQWSMPQITSTNKTMLPIFDVRWGEGDTPPVKVTVLGSTKELLELRMEDCSFSKRTPIVITNAMELDSIPDPPVKQLQWIPNPDENSQRIDPGGSTNRPPPFHRRVGAQ